MLALAIEQAMIASTSPMRHRVVVLRADLGFALPIHNLFDLSLASSANLIFVVQTLHAFHGLLSCVSFGLLKVL